MPLKRRRVAQEKKIHSGLMVIDQAVSLLKTITAVLSTQLYRWVPDGVGSEYTPSCLMLSHRKQNNLKQYGPPDRNPTSVFLLKT